MPWKAVPVVSAPARRTSRISALMYSSLKGLLSSSRASMNLGNKSNRQCLATVDRESSNYERDCLVRLQEVHPISSLALLDVAPPLRQKLVAESHQHSDPGFVFRLRHENLLAKPGVLQFICQGPQAAEKAEGWETVMEALDEAIDVGTGFDEAYAPIQP